MSQRLITRTLFFFSFSAIQDRAKIQSRRRPPSRAARKTAAAQSSGGLSDDFFGPQSPTSPTGSSADIPPIVTSPLSPPHVPSPTDVLDTTKSQPAVDMFGNEDMFSSDLPKGSAKSVIERSDTDTNKSSSGDIFSDTLFSAKTQRQTEKVGDFDVLFSGTKHKADSLENDDSDIFNTVPKIMDTKTKQHVSVTKTNEKTKQKSQPVAIMDDDDLFSSPVLFNTKPDKLSDPVTGEDKSTDRIQENGLPPQTADKTGAHIDNDDQDIFAVSTVGKKTGNWTLANLDLG